MSKIPNSPFSKVTSLIAEKDGDKFSFQANADHELLISVDALQEAVVSQRAEDGRLKKNMSTGMRMKMRPIIGVSGDSYWTLELIRRYISNLDNSFISMSKIVDLHIANFSVGRSFLKRGMWSKNDSEKLSAAYNSLRRLLYVETDSQEKMIEFSVSDLTNSAIPIWKTAMLCLFSPSLLTNDEILELWPLLLGGEAQHLEGRNFTEIVHAFLLNEKIDFHKINKKLISQRALLIKNWEERHKREYDPSMQPRSDPRAREIKKLDDYIDIEKVEIDSFAKRFIILQEIAKRQGQYYEG